MKKILSLILLATISTTIYADDSNWKMHPIFDEEVSHVIETPGYVYFTSKNLAENNNTHAPYSLFRYDKKGEELQSLSTSNILNGNNVKDLIYNPSKGYIAVVYKDFNIDLIYNNGKVSNIPYYRQSSLGYSKEVNSLSIDPLKDRIYLATDFGYIALNDAKEEVAESRIYGTPLDSYCRVGDYYFASTEGRVLSVPVNDPRLSLDQYEVVREFDEPVTLYPLNDKYCILLVGENLKKSVKKLTLGIEDLEIEDLFEDDVYNADYNSSGLNIATGTKLHMFKWNGEYSFLTRPENYGNSAATSENMDEVWNGLKRKGLSSVKKTGERWGLTRDWMLPNAPSPYASTRFLDHPQKGLIVLNYGVNPPTYSLWSNNPFLMSGYKQGRWNNLAPLYTNPGRGSVMTSPSGIAMDPDNNKYVYVSSYHNGVSRINLEDPLDIIHLSRGGDADANNSGFGVLVPPPPSAYSYIGAPFFDKQGNLWMSLADWEDTEDPNPHFYCWLAADRKASTPNDIRLPKMVEFNVYAPVTNYAQSIPLLKTGNGMIVYSAGTSPDNLVVIDTNGTPTETGDDKIYRFSSFTDSDGNNLEPGRIRFLWEDPYTGYVWVCHETGVCYFVPSQLKNNNYTLYRVKVPRNDGTNLADYLLDGVSVNHIATDSEGRKWFSTAGAGIVCTSSDGREIIEEFNSNNSPLPDDGVYGIGYDSASNSLMISTGNGYCEYGLPVSVASSTKEDIRAYPNPVRPGYSGYVTITDIPSGSFVKIVDVSGNLVRELGIMSGFEILWDVADSNFNRVKSGVYHIMVSPSDETSSYSTVGKILVMN